MAKQHETPESMLELWTPPNEAGEAIGCLSTTFTFHAGLFDEQCLARFLSIESDPDREDLAFLVERERNLGAVYAAVLVDHTQADVDHSLRWDVLPVRIPRAKQHAKISLLAWRNHVRIIVTSANLTEQGYRSNYEVCIALENTPDNANHDQLTAAIGFLRDLVAFVPGAEKNIPAVSRATSFLGVVEKSVSTWKSAQRTQGEWQHLVFTLPAKKSTAEANETNAISKSALTEALSHCKKRGGAPEVIWAASPFFDIDDDWNGVTESLCKSLARGGWRSISFCVPRIGDSTDTSIRLAAPASLLCTANKYVEETTVEILPLQDEDGNHRPWHAKMLGLSRTMGNGYTALMIGSSNFTRAGMGIGNICNAEANVLTIAEHLSRSRLPGQLSSIWPEMDIVENLDLIEWVGADPDLIEEERAELKIVPEGFLAVTFQAGEQQALIIHLIPERLPKEWSIQSTGSEHKTILTAEAWQQQNCPSEIIVAWNHAHPPVKLLVTWRLDDSGKQEGFLPFNVSDAHELPPPIAIGGMDADDMLLILASTDPSAAFRAWAKYQHSSESFDEELDNATPPELDPLRRHELKTTFLRRVRNRARVLTQLRKNMQSPAWSAQSLKWRLEGFIGIRELAQRIVCECMNQDTNVDESLLTLADLVILLSEVHYEAAEGALSVEEFNGIYQPFLRGMVGKMDQQVRQQKIRFGKEVFGFWKRVVKKCLK